MTRCLQALPRGLAWLAALAVLLSGCAAPPGAATPPTAEADAAAGTTAAKPPNRRAAASNAAQEGAQPYLFALDPLRPSVIVENDDAAAQRDLWVRVRAGFAMPDIDNALVLKWQEWYATRPDYVQRMSERSSRYLFHVVEEIDKRGMPTELALLPFIESAFNPQAMSVARASGMWQFMPATGKDFDLKQNLFRDDRRDVLASTRAALDYLQMLHGQFNDWQLALAAYNWGQGNVQRAVERNLKAGLQANYESLRMPDETRNYLPKLQAVKNIVLQPRAFAIVLPPLHNHPYFLSVPITNDIDVDVAVRLAGVPLEEFQALNPQMNKPVILAAGTPQVLLPYENATQFLRNLRTHRAPLATWTAWVAPATMKPADVARQVGMGEEHLRAVNRIPPRMLVKAGSTLVVPRSTHRSSDVSEHVADNASLQLTPDRPPGRRLAVKAHKGDSVAAVAARYRVSAEQVAQWNGMRSDARLERGQVVVVYQPVGAVRPGKRSTAAAAAQGKPDKSAKRTASAESKRPVAAAAPHAAAGKTKASSSRLASSGGASKL
ncbi:MAG TPA: transglycosylase SLT domain-containing protein [Rubrivivax sp.]|nr:transglycosylase SLT domain-containing protein [Rubrivivax sp.]